MKITKYPQSCFLINLDGVSILIDPGSCVYQTTDIKPEDFKNIDLVLLTHQHRDHTDPETLRIITQNNRPLILTNQPTHDLLTQAGIESEIIGEGEIKHFQNIFIKGIAAKHGNLPDGKPGPAVIGFLINDKIYHPGDTLYLKEKPFAEVVLVPMCDTVCMSPEEAAHFVKEIHPKLVIPMHYHNPNFITDPKLFAHAMENSGIPVQIMNDQETIEV